MYVLVIPDTNTHFHNNEHPRRSFEEIRYTDILRGYVLFLQCILQRLARYILLRDYLVYHYYQMFSLASIFIVYY